ncbi:uncharacterized protein LOC143146159 [Ptiloglossa arizonensis]|uniref:uncharacterized protein LOC143146159 n=1 Tax=Ptiloglossa arizonensis TaxID=3350558 RepID=UPI003FA07076
MNGIRTLVLQDLPYVLPSKNLQVTLLFSLFQLSSHLHTTVSSRRFWNFFEFTPKEEICQDVEKCSKDMVSSSMISPNETMEEVSKTVDASRIGSSLPLSPKIHGFSFDLKPSSVNHPRIPNPLQEDNLVSLLDGTPVPRTLKWKLKGYKTLRNEQAGDFAFVPGGESSGYDFDVLPRNDLCETRPKTTIEASRPRDRAPIRPKTTSGLQYAMEDTLSLTTKSIENKEPKKIEHLESTNIVEAKLEESNDAGVAKYSETIPTVQKLLPMPVKMENVKYLPISKPETVRTKCRAQPIPRYPFRPTENTQKSVKEYLETVIEAGKSKEGTIANEKPVSGEYLARTSEKQGASFTIDPQVSPKTREKILDSLPVSSLAPTPYKRESFFENKPTKHSLNVVDETINKVETPLFELSSPLVGPGVESSVHAATRFGFRGSDASRARSSFNGSSMSGNSAGGGRKPPGPSPPFVALRSSSGNASLTRRPSHRDRNAINNSALSISTSVRRLAPKECDDRDETTESKTVCTKSRTNKRNRRCEQETRPKCKKVPKNCKRHCCTELQTPVYCDYDKFQCPQSQQKYKQTNNRRPKRKLDPTCLSNESERHEPRRKCYANRCNRERSCDRDRYDRRDHGERRSCNRQRERSCKRQERNTCAERDQGREICTKPRRRESCGREKSEERVCGKRSAKCNGRRNYTQSAGEKQSNFAKRFSSVPTLGFSLIGMRLQGNESKQTLFGSPSKNRYYGSKDSPPPGWKNEIHSKESSTKCPDRKTSRNKCKKEAENKCKTPSKTRNVCKRAKEECKTPSKTRNVCKRTKEECKTPSKTRNVCKRTKEECKTPGKTKNVCKPSEDKCKTTSKTNTSCKPAENKCSTPSKTRNTCKRIEDMRKISSKTNTSCKQTKNMSKREETVCKRAADKSKAQSKMNVCENMCKTPSKNEKSYKRAENKCGTPRKVENECKSTGSVSKPETPTPCKQTGSKSADCSKKRELICKDKKQSASSEESVKERLEREQKETKECKKDSYKMEKCKGKDDNKTLSNGSKRVLNPCTQEQSNKNNDKYSASPTELTFIGTPSNCLAKTATFMKLDNKSFNNLSDRSYSTERHSRSNDELHESFSNQWQDNWKYDEEDIFGLTDNRVPIVIENQEVVPDDNSFAGNWFLSWFHHTSGTSVRVVEDPVTGHELPLLRRSSIEDRPTNIKWAKLVGEPGLASSYEMSLYNERGTTEARA